MGGYNSGRIAFAQLEKQVEKLGKIEEKHRKLQEGETEEEPVPEGDELVDESEIENINVNETESSDEFEEELPEEMHLIPEIKEHV